MPSAEEKELDNNTLWHEDVNSCLARTVTITMFKNQDEYVPRNLAKLNIPPMYNVLYDLLGISVS